MRCAWDLTRRFYTIFKECEGVVQRFEYTFELAWNVLKDRLEYDGVRIETITPRNVIREACKAKLIENGKTWMDMLTDRNKMSHTPDLRPSSETYTRAI